MFRQVYPTGHITAERDGCIHEQLASMIEVPVEIRNRRTEVIFLVVNGVTESPNKDPDGMDLTADHSLGHCQIAAIARANGMTPATHNVAESERVSGLLVVIAKQVRLAAVENA